MSHVAAIDLFVTDLDALDEACKSLGLVLVRNKTSFTWFGQWVGDYTDPNRAAVMKGYDPKTFGQCEHVIRREGHKAGDYEVGLVRRPDGQPGWSVVFDDFSSGRYFSTKFGGPNMPELKTWYTAMVSERMLQRKGYQTRRQYSSDHKLQIVGSKRS